MYDHRLPNGLRITDGTPGIVGFPRNRNWEDSRLAILASDQAMVEDPWQRTNLLPFNVNPRELLERATRRPPPDPGTSVSSFTEWIYSLYRDRIDPESLRQGKDAESRVLRIRRLSTSMPAFVNFQTGDWKLTHNGMQRDPKHPSDVRIFEVPALKVRGHPIQACPDLVFTKGADGQVVIVEIKFSMRIIPANLWPNVWAQLWAYSKIPDYASASRQSVIGEVWGDNGGGWSRSELRSSIYLRRYVRRDPRAPAFDRFFRCLFEIYGGTVEA